MSHMKSVLAVATIVLSAGCSSRFEAFGFAGPAPDHRPYFVVFDGPGRVCDTVKFDGTAWTHPDGVPVPVSEGTHRIECGGMVVTYVIPDGLIYKLDYR